MSNLVRRGRWWPSEQLHGISFPFTHGVISGRDVLTGLILYSAFTLAYAITPSALTEAVRWLVNCTPAGHTWEITLRIRCD